MTHMVQWLVVLVALLLLSNVLMMGMMAYGFSYLKSEVDKVNTQFHSVTQTVDAVRGIV